MDAMTLSRRYPLVRQGRTPRATPPDELTMATTQATAKDAAQTVSLGYASGDLADATIVIFGASGDLTARKLLPAVFRLWQGGYLSKKAPIVRSEERRVGKGGRARGGAEQEK